MSKIHNFSVHCIFGQLKGLIINHLICDQRYLLVADWPISISSLNLPGRSNLLTRMWSWAYTELLQKLYTLRYFSCTYRLNFTCIWEAFMHILTDRTRYFVLVVCSRITLQINPLLSLKNVLSRNMPKLWEFHFTYAYNANAGKLTEHVQ